MILNSRIDLAKYFNEKGFNIGAEIGVAEGRYSEILCQEIKDLKLYCIDCWEPYEKNNRGKKYQDEAYAKAKKRLSKYDTELIKKTSIEASLDIPDNSLDFVFLDGSHIFDHAMTDIIIWSRKVKTGGTIACHDYMHFTDSGVVEAVNKYTEIHRIEINLINRNQKNHNDDRQPVVWWNKK